MGGCLPTVHISAPLPTSCFPRWQNVQNRVLTTPTPKAAWGRTSLYWFCSVGLPHTDPASGRVSVGPSSLPCLRLIGHSSQELAWRPITALSRYRTKTVTYRRSSTCGETSNNYFATRDVRCTTSFGSPGLRRFSDYVQPIRLMWPLAALLVQLSYRELGIGLSLYNYALRQLTTICVPSPAAPWTGS
jgi:hypothetical protein